MKNILIIGGSYFIGRVFVEELQDYSEYAVYVLNRGNKPLKLPGVQEVRCDRHDAVMLSRAVPSLDWDAVVDFCAYEPDDVALVLQNLPGSVGRYIYISTVTVYQNSLTLPIRENAPKLDGPFPGPMGDYAYKKLLTELKLEELCRERGIAYICLRPAFIYGKYNYAPRESYFFNLIAKGETIILPSSPQTLFSMVSVWDVSNICIACLGNENVFNNAYNVCSEELISYDRLIEVIEAITDRKLNVRRQPVRMIEAQNIPLPFPLEEHLVYSGAMLQKTLKYEYMSFQEGMMRSYNWYFQVNT